MEEIVVEPEGDQELSVGLRRIKQIAEVLVTMETEGLKMPHTVHPEYGHLVWYPTVEQAADLVRALGGKFEKNDPSRSDYHAQYLIMTQQCDLLKFEIIVSRGEVCERKVVGTERKKVTKYVKVEVDEDVDIVEYECGSLYSAAERDQMARLAATTPSPF